MITATLQTLLLATVAAATAAAATSSCAYRDPVSGVLKDLWDMTQVQPVVVRGLPGGRFANAVFCPNENAGAQPCDTPAGSVNDSLVCLRDESGDDLVAMGRVPSGGYAPEFVSHNASAFDLVFRNGQPCGPSGKPASVTYEYRCAENVIAGSVRANLSADACGITLRVPTLNACSDPPPCFVKLPPYGVIYDFGDVAKTYKFSSLSYDYPIKASVCPGQPVDPWETECAKRNASVCNDYDGILEVLARPGRGNWTVPAERGTGLSVVYNNGDVCDQNSGALAQTTIHYVCALKDGPTGVVSFTAIGSCYFRMVVATAGACTG
jgi:hypothetical protein